ncbi:protein BCP1, putative [Plasmodium ovale curtisi]|uniref:Protein BCP1, putative n=1 Tax=Plasmodium ovale curtisi TaxID=864141 RepID=A0A1A8WYQ0_PLAOA|nr:protein BCP1, putative [Plasmodium ovale curtisi]
MECKITAESPKKQNGDEAGEAKCNKIERNIISERKGGEIMKEKENGNFSHNNKEKNVYNKIIMKNEKKKKKKNRKRERRKKKLLNRNDKEEQHTTNGRNNETKFKEEKGNNKNEELIVDFELVDPNDTFKDNVRILLKSTELYNSLKCSEQLINIICDQQNIGKFVQIANEEEKDNNIISFATIININQYDEINNLKEFLLDKIKKINKTEFQQSGNELTKLMSNGECNIGLLISSRLINCPIKLIPLIYKNIIDDVIWSQGVEDMEESEKKFYFFDYILFYTKVYKNVNDELIFSNYEEHHFFENKIHHVMWNTNNVKKFYEIANDKNSEVSYKEYATIFIIPFDMVSQTISKISTTV